jgi:hypothetical protein
MNRMDSVQHDQSGVFWANLHTGRYISSLETRIKQLEGPKDYIKASGSDPTTVS